MSRGRNQRGETLQRELDLRHRRPERESQVTAEARGAAAAALARIDVEELAGDGDHLAVEGGAEERRAVADRLRQVLRRRPHVERALGRQIDGEPEVAEPFQQALALLAELGL